ncbi:MAG TPA: LCP family protein [Pseudonocardiaceae bacterium]|nr:LCP family protein [Pseudonocardiaceae bacterium]
MSDATSPHHRYHRSRRIGKALVAAVACLVFLVTATGWAVTQWLDGQLRDVHALDPHSAAITDAEAQRGDENVLLVGSDSRIGAQPGDGVGGTVEVEGARSDTVMVAHLPADRSRAVIVSFPRDLQIQRPRCDVWDPVSGSYTGRMDAGASVAKLNTAYQVGGPLCATKVVQELSGLAVTRFVGVGFPGFRSMVDAVGGVRICVERPLKDGELGTIIPQRGYTTISGTTALNYVRARHVAGDPTSDYGRIARQQYFLSALVRQVLSPGVLLNPAKVRALITAVAANTVGENIGASALLTLAQSVQGLDPANVTFVTVPTTGSANKYGNEELRVRDAAALFRAIIDGSPLPGEQSASNQLPRNQQPPSPNSSPAAPAIREARDVRVRVLNGSGIVGAATRASRALRADGFSVLAVGKTRQRVDTTMIRYPPDQEAEALTLLATVPQAVLQVDQRLTGSVVLVVGPDFRRPATAAPAAAPRPAAIGPPATVNAADAACS